MNGYFEDAVGGFRDRFNAAVSDFDSRVAALNQAEADLWDVQPTVQASGDASMQAGWQNAMDRVIAMNASIDSVRAQVQKVATWWAGVKSSFGIAPGAEGTLSGLALIPAIPWSVLALIVGGTTAIAGVIYSASLVINRARQYRLQQANIDAAQSGGSQVVDVAPDTGGGFFDTLGGIADAVPWIIGGALVLMVLPHLRGRQ